MPVPAGRLLVVCKDDQTLEVIDLATGTTAGSVRASGVTPHEVTATPDGRRAYLPIYSDAYLGDPGTDGRGIDVIDLETFTVEKTIPLDFASRPHLPLMGPDGSLFVGTELDESVSVIEVATGDRLKRLPTGRPESHMFAMSADARRVFTSNVASGTMSAIDVETQELLAIVDLGTEVNRISLSPDGKRAYLSDQAAPRIAVVDLDRLELAGWIDVPSRGFGTQVTPDGRSLVVALRWACQVGVVDLATNGMRAVVDVPAQPQAIVLDSTGRWAYSACDADGVAVEVDLVEGRVARVFPTGRNPDGIWWVA